LLPVGYAPDRHASTLPAAVLDIGQEYFAQLQSAEFAAALLRYSEPLALTGQEARTLSYKKVPQVRSNLKGYFLHYTPVLHW
jgi:hypothetical protein